MMAAAFDTASTAICLSLAPTEVNRAAMFAAIADAVADGEHDFVKLQQKAIDAWGARAPVRAVERRQRPRLVPDAIDDLAA